MKKLLLVLTLACSTLAVTAQQYFVQDLLNVKALQVTNTIAASNLAATGSTNVIGLCYTNLFGTWCTNTVANAAYTANFNTLKDWVPIPTDFAKLYGQGTINGTNTTQSPYCAYFHTRVVGGSSANTATTIVLQLSADGVTADTTTTISISVMPNTTTTADVINKLTVAQLQGYKALRVYTVTAGDTDASSNAIYTKMAIGWWVP